MWAGGVLRMILDGEGLEFLVAHSFQAAVIEIYMCHFNLRRIKTFRINTETVILRGNFHFARSKIFYRLITTAMAEFKLVCAAAVGQTKHLVTKADAENRQLAKEGAQGFDNTLNTSRVARSVGEEDTIRFHRHNGCRICGRWNDLNLTAKLCKYPELIEFDAEVIGHNFERIGNPSLCCGKIGTRYRKII